MDKFLDVILSYDFTWFFTIAVLIISFIAQIKVSSTFSKYNKVKTFQGITAAQVARQILDSNGLYHIQIERISGNLTDHYDPRNNKIALSQPVYDSTSVAAIGVAAHEVGHAIQYANNYKPIKIRNAILPIAQIGSQAWLWIFILGMVLEWANLVFVGIALFFFIFLFQLVTLPVEFNASNRAIATLERENYLGRDELNGAKKVLGAAAMTYVAAMLSSLATLLRLLSRTRKRN